MRNPFSNAPAGYPDTSRTGYPLFYPIGGDGQPSGSPRIVYDGQTFADEQEVEVYKLRAKRWDENAEAYRTFWAAQEWTAGPIQAADADIEDARYVRYMSDRNGRNFWYAVFSGSNIVINALINESSPLPHDYDPRTYYGPARDVIDALL